MQGEVVGVVWYTNRYSYPRGHWLRLFRIDKARPKPTPSEKALAALKYHIVFPNEQPARIVRRGVLACEGAECDFVLVPANSFIATADAVALAGAVEC